MHIAQRYDSDQVVFTRNRARADAALNSPLIAPGLPPLLCMRSCNHQEWQTWMADLLWCLMQECKTECKGLTFQQKSDNFNLALQTVPFSINKYLFFLPPLMGYVEEFTYISFFCDSDSDSHRLYLLLHWLRPIMWIWQDLSASI